MKKGYEEVKCKMTEGMGGGCAPTKIWGRDAPQRRVIHAACAREVVTRGYALFLRITAYFTRAVAMLFRHPPI